MPSHEIGRQEAIHELIYTEDDYVRDLKILDQVRGNINNNEEEEECEREAEQIKKKCEYRTLPKNYSTRNVSKSLAKRHSTINS